MSETRKYNLRSRSKKIHYSDDRRDRDNVANFKQVKLTQNAKGKSKKTPRKDKSDEIQPERSKSSQITRHGQEHERKLENNVGISSSDDSSSDYDSGNMQGYQSIHLEKGSSNPKKSHRLETHNATRSLPSKDTAYPGVRNRLPGMSTSDLIYQKQSHGNNKEDFYSEEEPDSTVADDQSFHAKFGKISPIRHDDESYEFSNHGNYQNEARDKMMSHGSRESRPVLKRHKSKEEIMKIFRNSVCREIVWSIVVLVIISFIAVALILMFEDAKNAGASSTRMTRFENHMEKLKVQFRSQTSRFWRVVGGASFSHVKDPSTVERPVVLLLVGTYESATTVSCLATKLATMFDDIFQSSGLPVVIKGNNYLHKDSDKAKKIIDSKLKSAYDSGSKSAVIHNIDNLPPCSMLLFHSYCENDNAPYKDIAIIQTVQLAIDAVDLHNLRPRDLDATVGMHLKMIWDDQCPSEMSIDKQDAILSRIANNVVMVKEEDTIDILKACS